MGIVPDLEVVSLGLWCSSSNVLCGGVRVIVLF